MAEGKKWFAYGCFGCLGIMVLVAVVVGVIAGTALYQVRREKVQERVLTRDVAPTAAVPGAEGEEAGRPPGAATLPPDAAPTESGRVVLDLSRTEFEIEPGRPGEPIRVEASYDESSHDLEERFDEGDGGSWTYHVRFQGKGSNVMNALKAMFGGTQPKLRVYLPVDVPLSLELSLVQGGGYVDLGGLWLREAEVELAQGGLQLDVDRPLRQPMERLVLRGSMGGMEISRLGNASPRELLVDFSMGGLELDLRGQWVTDSEISFRSSMGGAVLRLPRDVVIEGLDSDGVRLPEQREIDLPTLRFDASSSMGDVQILY